MANKYVRVLTGGANSFETTAEHLNATATNVLSQGVVGAITNTAGVAPATGGFAVNAQGTPDMTVAVTGGKGYVTGTPTGQASQTLEVYMDAAENVTISANATGGTRYDHLYLAINATNANTPSLAGTNVLTLTTSRSTSASTDDGTPPTYGYLIAVITVANGASTITNGTIADKRERVGFNGGLNDDNDNEVVKIATTASAVNEITVTNAATTGNPSISATGDDTNITLALAPKGSGALSLASTFQANFAGQLLSGYAERTSNFSTTTFGSYVDVTDLTVTVTVPAGGRRIRLTAWVTRLASSQATGAVYMAIRESSTILGEAIVQGASSNNVQPFVSVVTTPSAGSHTYKVSIQQDATGTITHVSASTSRAYILVEAL